MAHVPGVNNLFVLMFTLIYIKLKADTFCFLQRNESR